MLSLADVALSEPAMANAVRTSADILRWQAQVRNPNAYGERTKVEASVTTTTEEPVNHIELAKKIAHIMRLAERPQADPSRVQEHERVVAEFVPSLPTHPMPRQAAPQPAEPQPPAEQPELVGSDPDRSVF
jgi:hypothetical protein